MMTKGMWLPALAGGVGMAASATLASAQRTVPGVSMPGSSKA